MLLHHQLSWKERNLLTFNSSAMEKILGKYMHEKNLVNPLTLKKLSVDKRIESLHSVVANLVYGEKYTIDQRIFASSLITEILKEEKVNQ
jgi:hypothetical protein